jgi:hypothetical protein
MGKFLAYAAAAAAALCMSGDSPSVPARQPAHNHRPFRHWHYEESDALGAAGRCDVWFRIDRLGRTNVASYAVVIGDPGDPEIMASYDVRYRRNRKATYGVPEPTTVKINVPLNIDASDDPHRWVSNRAKRAVEMLLNGEYPTTMDEPVDISTPRE